MNCIPGGFLHPETLVFSHSVDQLLADQLLVKRPEVTAMLCLNENNRQPHNFIIVFLVDPFVVIKL